MTTPSVSSKSTSGRLWAMAPIAILGGLFTVQGIMLSLALDDPGFAVEQDYYENATKWDQHMAQEQTNLALGWHVEIASSARHTTDSAQRAVLLTLSDASKKPIERAEIRVVTFHNARAAARQEPSATELSPGIYQVLVDVNRSGWWELKLNITKGDLLFTKQLRTQLRVPSEGDEQ